MFWADERLFQAGGGLLRLAGTISLWMHSEADRGAPRRNTKWTQEPKVALVDSKGTSLDKPLTGLMLRPEWDLSWTVIFRGMFLSGLKRSQIF